MNQEDFYRMVNAAEGSRSIAFPALMRKVYTWMALALAITGITAFGVANSPNLIYSIYSNSAIVWGLMIAEIVAVVYLSARISKMSLTTATMVFILYSVLNGVTLSCIFLVYSLASIATTFFICAGTFGAMSLIGYTTKKDLTGMGQILYMALIGLVIATLVNLFVKSSGFQLILSYVGVIIFVGLTAWDTQKIKQMSLMVDNMDESAQKLAVMGALTLYLDFINLFLYLLRIFGSSRD